MGESACPDKGTTVDEFGEPDMLVSSRSSACLSGEGESSLRSGGVKDVSVGDRIGILIGMGNYAAHVAAPAQSLIQSPTG